MGESEEKIIRKAVAGDRSAFRQLVLDHSHAMFRLAWHVVGEESLAEDVVQDAFIKAWNKLADYRGEASFRAWLHRIVVNCAMDHLRKQARRNRFEKQEPEYETLGESAVMPRHATQIDIRQQAEAAMKELSDTERAALMLRHYEGHSISEISEMLEITTGACKQTIFRAVKKMRIALQPLVAT